MSEHSIRRILTLHCNEASRLASESLDHRLGRADRLALRLHLWICAPCRRFLKQIATLRRIAKLAESRPPDFAMPDEVRGRLGRSPSEGRD